MVKFNFILKYWVILSEILLSSLSNESYPTISILLPNIELFEVSNYSIVNFINFCGFLFGLKLMENKTNN